MTSNKPTFEECKHFNATLWHRFRTGYMNGDFSYDDAKKFLEKYIPVKGMYIAFKTRPQEGNYLPVTVGFPYVINEVKIREFKIFKDNDFSVWVTMSNNIEIVPPEKVRERVMAMGQGYRYGYK